MAAALSNSASSPALTLSGSLSGVRRPSCWGRGTWCARSLLPPTPTRRCSGRTRQLLCIVDNSSFFSLKAITSPKSEERCVLVPRCTGSGSSGGGREEPSASSERSEASFGYSRKDVLLIGVGVTALGVGLKSSLEFVGVDPLQAGNAVQLIIVLGLTVGWISTYMFRVANKDMTYAQQLKDYEKKVMEKRLESLSEAELEALLEQVEEEKRQLTGGGDQVK